MLLIAVRPGRLDKFLAEALPTHSRSKLTRLIDAGEVLVNGRLERAAYMVHEGDQVKLEEPQETPVHDLSPANIPLRILFEDEFLLVVNKPRGLASHPAASLKEPSLVNALLARRGQLSSIGGDFRPGIVHRLDRETTGLMVVAKTDSAHVHLARQIETKTAERRYFALVSGSPESDRFSIDAPIGRNQANRLLMTVRNSGKRAVTHLKRIRDTEFGALLGARLETGRTHQIRVHLSAVGLPVFGDRLYAPVGVKDGPLQLHAGYLEIDHPETETRMSFYVEPDVLFRGREHLSGEQLSQF